MRLRAAATGPRMRLRTDSGPQMRLRTDSGPRMRLRAFFGPGMRLRATLGPRLRLRTAATESEMRLRATAGSRMRLCDASTGFGMCLRARLRGTPGTVVFFPRPAAQAPCVSESPEAAVASGGRAPRMPGCGVAGRAGQGCAMQPCSCSFGGPFFVTFWGCGYGRVIGRGLNGGGVGSTLLPPTPP